MWKPKSSSNMVVTYNPATLEVSVASEAVALTVDSISNATASVTVGSTRVSAGNSDSVTPGQQATITVKPTNTNKKISTAYYNGNAVSLVSNHDGSYSGTFTMPNAATTVTFGSLTDKSSYKVKVAANDSSYGTVSIALAGGGTYDENTLYPEDTAFTLNASGTSDHPFQSWDKGTNTTANPATYYVNVDDADLDDPTVITITAAFKTNYYKADPKIYGDYTYVYQGISARFFDYYYDKEVKDGWLSYGENEAKNDNRQPYTILNQALKTYAETNNVLVPLYFGNMYAINKDVYDGMYGDQTPTGITGVTSGQNSLDYHFYWAANNSNGIKALYGEGDGYKYEHALTGLSGKSLNSSGNITHVSDKDSKTADNEVEMKLFDKDWLTSRSGSGYAYTGPLATIIDSPFPFVKETIKRIYFTNIGTYNKAYTWSVATGSDTYDIQHNGSWPGTDLKYDSAKGKYYINVSTFAEKLILSNNGSDQSDDISIDGNKNCYNVSTKTWSTVEDDTEANYYSFDSNNGQDNAYFTGIRDGEASPKMYYYFNRNKVKDRGTPQGYGFFPYDGNFAGTNSAAQDYGYGMRMDIEFTLGENGKNELGQDQVFKFSGDDDLWVYVDGNLVLDLGGAHGRSKGEINFGYTNGVNGASATANNTTVTVDDPTAYQMYSAGQNSTSNTTALPPVHYTSASEKGVTRNTTASVDRTKQKHTLTIFYMERGKEQSNLKIGFSFSPVSNEFEAEKSLNLNNVSSDATFKSAVEALANNDQFTFNNSWSDTVSGTFNAPASGLENTFTHSGTSTVKTTGDTKQIPDSSTKFKADDTDSFVDKFTVGHYFKLTETPDSSNKFNYDDRLIVTDTAQNDKRLTPADAENGVYKFDTVKTNPHYEIDPVLLKATHINTLKTRSLTIKKQIDGDPDPTTTFPIQVKIKLDKTAADLDANYVAYQLPYVKSGGTSGTLGSDGKVSLKQNETITIEGIPENASVRVSEPDALSNDYHQASCVVKASDDSSVSTTSITNGQQFAIGSKDINVVITNIKESKKSFTIKKEMAPNSEAETGDFTIKVETSTDGSKWTALANAAFTTNTTRGTGTLNGNGETTIKADEILTFTNLVNVNTYIRVAEAKAMPLDNRYVGIAATVGGSTASVTDYDDTAWKGGFFQLTDAAAVIITNNKVHRRTITITKTTTASYDDADAKFRIRIETSTDGTTWTDYHADIPSTLGNQSPRVSATNVSEGVYEYLIQKNQFFTLSLPEGTRVRVTENVGDKTGHADYDVNNYYNYNSTVVNETNDTADKGTAYTSTDSKYKGSAYTVAEKDAQFTIKNNPIMQTVTVVKETDFVEDGSTFELGIKIKPNYTSNTDYIVDNDGLVKVRASDSGWTAPSTKPTDGKYHVKKTGSIKFSVPKGSRLQVTETPTFGYSQITGKQRFTFDKMVLDTDDTTTPSASQENGRNFVVTGNRTLTVYNKVMKNNVTIRKQFVDSVGENTSEHKIKIIAMKNGSAGDYYGTEYAKDASNDDRIKYTTSLDPTTVRHLTGTPAGDVITIHGNEAITLQSLYVGSYITVQEIEVGDGYKFDRIDVTGYADDADTAQFPNGVPSGVSIPAKTYDATNKTVSFQTHDVPAQVKVVNEKLPLYDIKYKYEGYSATTYKNTTDKDADHRVVGAERFFVQSGYITETELNDWFNVTGSGGDKTISFKTEETKKSFISAHAPYEDDFMMDLKWDGKTVSTPVYTPATKTLSLEITATSAPDRTVNVYFKLPYDVDNQTLEPSSDAPAKKDAAVQHPMTTQYGNWVTTNNEYKDEEAADFVTAPLTLANGEKFQYWRITSKDAAKRNVSVESKRCYYDQFNMTMYQDCYVEPVYEASSADFDPSARSLADTKNGEAIISFIENSRNQWNEQGGGTGMTGDKLKAGDRIYSDFLLTFGYKDRLLNSADKGGVEAAGFVLEQVAELDKNGDKYVTKSASEYAAAYKDTVNKDNVKTYIAGQTVDGFVNKSTIDLSGLDNKNQTKYSFSIKNKAYGTLEEGTAKNYVYRAYSYLKVEGNIVVSDPVYFTIYDIASIELGQTDAQGGQS